MNDPSSSRRRFLKIIAVGGLGAAGASCSSSSGITGPVSAGNISALPVNTLTAVAGQAVAIGRDSKGVYAMTLICTHESCDIADNGTVSFAGVDCSCHGSRFDANGNVLAGPATSPLVHYQVTIDGTGAITIDGGTQVDASVRVMPPMA